jgi:ribosomal protein L7/L12/outer membrane protein assembly factor BamB
MTKTFNCPSCGAPLDYDGGDDLTIRCPFCNSSVIVPAELRTETAETPASLPPVDPLTNTLGHLKEFGEIASLVQAGNKIEAVKLYRQITGAGLREAKDAIDLIAAGKMREVANYTISLGQFSPPASNLAAKMQEIQRLIRSGNKIEAIKVYREATGAGLKESKDVIDRLTGGRGIQVSSYTVRLGEAGAVSDPRADKIREIGRLLKAGNKIEAIKVYRETFNVGLKEAKDAVEKLATTVDTPDAFEIYPVEINPASALDRHPARPTTMAANFEPVGASPSGCGRIALLGLVGLILLVIVGAGAWAALSANGGDNRLASLVNDYFATTTAIPVPPTVTIALPDTPVPTSTPPPTPTPEFAGQLLSFGEDGNGPGQFNDARAIGVDGAGNIYVGDYDGGRVQMFDIEGNFVRQWNFEGQQTFLSGLAVSQDGTVYAVRNGNIERYEGGTGKALGKIAYDKRQGFQSVAAIPGGGLVASWNKDWAGGLFTNFSESQDDIVVFDGEGKVTTVIAQALSVAAGGNPELNTTLAADDDGAIYAFGDLNGNVIFKFSPDGKFLDRFTPDASERLNALALDSEGRLYVAGSRGIQVYDTEGRYLDAFDSATFASGLAFNTRDELFAVARTKVIKYGLTNR